MRLAALLLVTLTLAAPAAAGVPQFGIFDLHDLAPTSHNLYGDVKVARSPAALHGFVVHCGSECRFGSGWLAFARGPGIGAGDVASAKALAGRFAWTVQLVLTTPGRAHWTAFSKLAAARLRSVGVPDVFAVVVGGSIVALPYANGVRYKRGTLDLAGFSRAGALLTAKTLKG
jgi:hypothetical protein